MDLPNKEQKIQDLTGISQPDIRKRLDGSNLNRGPTVPSINMYESEGKISNVQVNRPMEEKIETVSVVPNNIEIDDEARINNVKTLSLRYLVPVEDGDNTGSDAFSKNGSLASSSGGVVRFDSIDVASVQHILPSAQSDNGEVSTNLELSVNYLKDAMESNMPVIDSTSTVPELESIGVKQDQEQLYQSDSTTLVTSLTSLVNSDSTTAVEPKERRFRKVARMIKHNLLWTRSMKQEKEQEETTTAFVVNTDQKEALVFDVSYFQAKSHAYGGLTPRARTILYKRPLDRTEEELMVLQDLVERLRCFDKYSRKMKHELARMIYFDSVEDGRVIIQQGHVGVSFYIIVTGTVIVKITAIDQATGRKCSQILGELSEGATFGELALMHDIERTATITSKGNCEFIRIDKSDFAKVLSNNYEQEWKERMAAFSWLPAFKDWTRSELEICNNNCILKEYQPNKIIFGNSSDTSDYICFIITGQCRLVRQLVLMRKAVGLGKTTYVLPTESERLEISNQIEIGERKDGARRTLPFVPVIHHWTISTLNRGYYFGVGEMLTDTYIITKCHAALLLVPRVQFLKLGKGTVLERMKEELNGVIPSNEKLLKLHFESRRWDKFKGKVVQQVVNKRRIPNPTRLSDVPRSIREDA